MTAVDDTQSEERKRQERLDAIASARAASSAEEARAIGVAYRAEGDFEIAWIALEHGYTVATSWKEKLSILAVLAPTYRSLRRPGDALRACEHAVELGASYDEDSAVYTSMTATLRQLGRLDEARHHGEELLQRFPEDSYVLNALAAVYGRLSVRDADLALAEKAEELSLRSTELAPERNGLRLLQDLLQTLDDLCTVLEEAGDTASGEIVMAQKRRVARHLARLTAPPPA